MANTHRVKLEAGLWLRLRSNFNTNPTSAAEEVSESEHFWETEVDVTSYAHGTEFELIEEGLGYGCNWDHVRRGEAEGYLYNVYTEVINPDDYERMEDNLMAIPRIGMDPA